MSSFPMHSKQKKIVKNVHIIHLFISNCKINIIIKFVCNLLVYYDVMDFAHLRDLKVSTFVVHCCFFHEKLKKHIKLKDFS